MHGRWLTRLLTAAVVCLFVAGAHGAASAQGRGHGGGGGGGAGRGVGGGGGVGMGGGVGRPDGAGVDRGIGTSSDRSGGRSDAGHARASDNSGGRSDAGLDRARMRRENAHRADEELRDHPDMPARLHTTARDLREGYQAALAANPDLKFGQYVAATRIAANLGGRHPSVTRSAILSGLASGRSIGQTLQDLGVGEREAKDAKRQAERELKESKRRS